MVFYSASARSDLDEIRQGLLSWERITLTEEFVSGYMDELRTVCDSLDAKTYHISAMYAIHLRYGTKVHLYKRNNHTTWYIIYDLDRYGNVFINKIISNYLTVS
jgi:hypothetical protein